MGDFKRLLVWRKAHALALHAHRAATRIRGREHASLRSQMIRAAFSVAANIVEGHGQASRRDFSRFLGYSINSVTELEYHVLVGRDLALVERAAYLSIMGQIVEVRRMLHGLRTSLNRPARERGAACAGRGNGESTRQNGESERPNGESKRPGVSNES